MPAIAHQNKILGNTSGGGSTILVTTSESTLYGQTVTLSDGTTTMSGTFSNTGECEFTGVMMVGTLTATSGTASTSINVPYFGVYSMTLSFFSATITATFPSGATCTCVGNGETYTASTSPHTFTVHGAATYTVGATIDGASKQTGVVISTDGQTASVALEFGTIVLTYDNDFRGKTITCTKGGAQTITKTAPSSGNTMYFYPPTTGNWTISGTVSSDTYYSSPNPVVVSSLYTSVSATLETIPDGSTKTPTDDVSIWLACAGIRDKAYTTLTEVLSDSETFNALLGDSNACAYMARSTTWTTDICADQYAMNLLGQYDTACDALLSDATWVSAIANSTYFESVLNCKVPIMTSATTPSGVASGYNNHSNSQFAPWYAFDTNPSTLWLCYADGYLQYDFGSGVETSINIIQITPHVYQAGYIKDFIVKGSNDDVTYTEIYSGTHANNANLETYITEGATKYRDIRLYPTSHYTTGTDYGASAVQFYGRKSSGEKIHGGNPTYDSFYRIVDGNNVPVTDPSLLDAGTYTIYSNGLAKDPDDLSADYGKTIRICPNTKEIVVRPDNSLYWYGYEGARMTAQPYNNGTGTAYAPSVTKNQTSISLTEVYSSQGNRRGAYFSDNAFDFKTGQKVKLMLSSYTYGDDGTYEMVTFGTADQNASTYGWNVYSNIPKTTPDFSNSPHYFETPAYATDATKYVLISLMSRTKNTVLGMDALWYE